MFPTLRSGLFYHLLPINMTPVGKAFFARSGLLFLLFFSVTVSFAQQDSIGSAKTTVVDTSHSAFMVFPKPADSSRQDLLAQQGKRRRLLVTGINVLGYGGSLVLLNATWYKGYARSSFHTFDDSREWLQTDKLGHAWTAYNTGRASAAIWQWAGTPHKKAVLIGGLSGAAYLTAIEFLDAYSTKWGWSWSDIGANIFGSGLFMGQEFLWNEQRIQYKFSFHKNNYKEPVLENRANDLFGSEWYERMLKDYNAQSYWLSFNLKSFLPHTTLPAWLNISVGYGAEGMFGGFENKWLNNSGSEVTRYDIKRRRQWWLAPDIDFTKIKTRSKFLRTGFSMLNAFKFPAPAIELSRGKIKLRAIAF